jgi:hypothetical protein
VSEELHYPDAHKVKQLVSGGFMFENGTYYYQMNHGFQKPPSSEYTAFQREWAQNVLSKTLQGYSEAPQGTWKHELFTARDIIVKLILSLNRVQCDFKMVRILTFDSSMPLWNKAVQI